MQLDVGKIYDGKVTGITGFGAFVEIEPGTTGMVHISEVANTYVKEIKDHLKEGQEVKVKVLSTENGKISLSIKKAMENQQPRRDNFKRDNTRHDNTKREGFAPKAGDKDERPFTPRQQRKPQPPKKPEAKKMDPAMYADGEVLVSSGNASFEAMLNKFKQSSDEKMVDIKRNMDGKRRNTSRKK